MKKIVTGILVCSLLFTISDLIAQVTKSVNQFGKFQAASQMHQFETGDPSIPSKTNTFFPSAHQSPFFTVNGADKLPISTHYDVGTNSRAMHNLIVDPDNPQNLHFIAMETTNEAPSDTVKSNYPSRRVVYTFSADGGKTWKTPIVVGNVRLGFPTMILYKRGGVNVPIIAAHNGPNGAQMNWTIQVYIEQGNVGDGNFKLFATDRLASDGSSKDMGFPSMGLSLNQDTLYMLGCVVSQAANTPPQNLEFGKFALDATRGATWLGWLNEPGGLGNQTALSSGGRDLLRVAANGKIGVLWVQGDASDDGLYYVESPDGGKTWTQNYDELYTPDQNGPGGLLADYDGMDFYFDKNNIPHYVWQADYQVISSNTFYPYTAMILYWALGDNTVKILNSNVSIAPGFTTISIHGSDVNTELVSQSSYFTPPAAGGTVEPTGIPFISKVTTAFTSNPNFFRVYYSTFQDGDTMTVDQTGDGSSIKTYLFRSIYFQETTNGGANWSDPAPFIANNPNDPPENKLDYHFPSTSFINPIGASGITYHVNFDVDSFPGQLFANGQAGWSVNTWFHKSEVKNAVPVTSQSNELTLSQNYPNPFTVNTTIPVVMKSDDNVTLSITDILGREVAVIYHGRLETGSHSISCSVPNLGAGIYTYTLKTSTGSISRTMSLVK